MKRVLIVNELGPTSPAIALVDGAIRDGLEKSPYQVELYFEFLETTLFPDPAIQRQFFDSYIPKYQNRKPDVIIAIGPSPIRFLAQSQNKFFSKIPIVFCASSPEMADDPKINSSFTGVWETLEPAKIIDLALKLQPSTKHVFLVGGVAAFDRHIEAVLKDGLRHYGSRFESTDLTDLGMPKLLERLKGLPKDAVVLNAGISEDAAGTHYINASESSPMVNNLSDAPVFSLGDLDVQNGALGGYVNSFAKEGQIVADDAVRVLKGEKPQDIPIVRGANVYMFDWHALKRWGFRERDLPPGSIVLNREPSFWEAYKEYVIVGLLVCLAQALAILGLLWQRARRRKTEHELRGSEEKFSKSFRQSPLAVTIVSSSDGRYLDVNETFEERTGWKRDEVIGRTPLDIGLWVDPNQRSQFMKQIVAEGNVRNIEVRFRRKDGQIRTSLGSAELIEVGGKSCVLSVVSDITERKAAEEALASLSGRLIEAQEAERTRIARELHDDISQRMAMLTVRAKSLKKNLPPSDVKAIRTIEEMCDGASRLQADIQQLSHRLHSPKLDYLGLEAASAAFCRELSEQHEVEIDFQADEVPEELPNEVSLCLFRVLQEALHNALKHSGVRKFEVSLKGALNELQVIVHDSGIGFDSSDSALGNGLGLTSMKERLKLVDGQLVIESTPKKGTKIIALVPLASRVPVPYDSQARDH